MKRGNRILITSPLRYVLLLALGLCSARGFADPPLTVNIRGQLLNASGQALSGARDFRVQFYDAAADGTALGTAITGTAGVSLEGIFDLEVALPVSVLAAAEAWYELAISSTATPAALTPSDTFPNRVKVVSVPFALESSEANHVGVTAVGSGTVLDAEFEFLSGVTSGIQDQLDAKANTAAVYSKTEVDSALASKADASALAAEATVRGDVDTALQSNITAEASSRSSADGAKVDKAGDTMTGALTVNDSYVGVGQATAPGTVTDKLYNVGGTLSWNGNPAYRFPWTAVTAATQMAGNNGYIANRASMLTLTLPASASLNVGDTVRVNGLGAGGWKIAQNDAQQILTGTLQIPDYSGPWISRDSSRNWYGVASSSDGTKLVAYVSGGNLYTSADSGVTWTARDSSRNWYGAASSSDGTKLVASASGGNLYTSTDSGETWTARDSSRSWRAVASSSDGTKLVACVYSGHLCTSTDSGVTWTAQGSTGDWYGVASSSDGTKLVACPSGGNLYTSTDSGVTWTARDSSRNWRAAVSSSDGTKLVACAYGGNLYTSTDSGVTWIARDSSRNWYGVASSSDGTKLVACVAGGYLYTSADSGVTWTAHDSSRTWRGVASSSDGMKLAASGYGAYLYTNSALPSSQTATSAGTSGYITGGQNTAVELQFIGNDTFVPISYVGSLDAN